MREEDYWDCGPVVIPMILAALSGAVVGFVVAVLVGLVW